MQKIADGLAKAFAARIVNARTMLEAAPQPLATADDVVVALVSAGLPSGGPLANVAHHVQEANVATAREQCVRESNRGLEPRVEHGPLASARV